MLPVQRQQRLFSLLQPVLSTRTCWHPRLNPAPLSPAFAVWPEQGNPRALAGPWSHADISDPLSYAAFLFSCLAITQAQVWKKQLRLPSLPSTRVWDQHPEIPRKALADSEMVEEAA